MVVHSSKKPRVVGSESEIEALVRAGLDRTSVEIAIQGKRLEELRKLVLRFHKQVDG